jgi:hypothetical protein
MTKVGSKQELSFYSVRRRQIVMQKRKYFSQDTKSFIAAVLT